MGNCPTIELFIDDATLFLTGDSRLILDIDEKTNISLDKAIIIQDEALLLTRPEEIVLQIPATPKNFLYLKNLFDPATEKPNGRYIQCRITVGSDTLIYDRLYGRNKDNSVIEIRFTYGLDWIPQLKNLKLSDLNDANLPGYLGNIDFTKDDILDKWQNNAKYIDGDPGYWYPLVNYGGWREEEYHMAVTEDLRPWLHTLYVMQRIFERIGWCLQFPFYETDLGRRCIDYLLKSDYGDKANLRNLRRFEASKTYNPNTSWSLGNKIINWTELSDPGNTFSPGSGEHTAVFQGKYKVRVITTGSNTLLVMRFRVWKRRLLIGGSTGTQIGEFTVPLISTPTDHSFEFETSCTPNESVYITLESGDLDFIIGPCQMQVFWSNEVESTYYQNGDVIPIASEINNDITAWDYMLGNIHFCGGIVTEMLSEKIVRILTPFDADIFGDTIEGYFNDTLVQLTDKQPLNTTRSVVRDRLRFIKIAFAQTTDALAEKLRKEDGQEFFLKVYDLGDPLIDTEELPNPLFEYTLTRLNGDIIHLADIAIANGGFYLPLCLDNLDGDISKDIGPRKIIAYGYGPQRDTGARIVFENELYGDIAYAAQESKNVEFNGVEPEQKLIYGTEEGDLWSLVLGKATVQLRSALQLDILANLNINDWAELSLRNLFEVDYDGHPITGRLISVNDYRPCENLSVQGLLMPDLVADNYCIDTDPTTDCENFPVITQINLGECWFFAIAGDFDCTIESITWEVKFDGEEWQAMGTMDTLEVCAPDQIFLVRATIVYVCNCPDSIVVVSVSPCNSILTCALTPIYSQGQQCLSWDYNTDSDPNGCTYEATLEIYIDGVLTDTQTLLLGDLVCPINTDAIYVLTVVLNCSEINNCPELTTSCTYIPQAAPPPQCDNSPEVICNPVTVDGVTCYEFLIGGSQSDAYETFIVTYVCNGQTGTWLPGDAPICCSGTLEVHALVFYCNCPSVCTETIQCDASGCTLFDSGVWNPIAVCN